MDTPTFDKHSLWVLLSFLSSNRPGGMFGLDSSLTKRPPTFLKADGLPESQEVVTRTLEFARKGKLQDVMDSGGPRSFSTEVIRNAFRTLESRHCKGKVVVKVADP